MINLKFYKCNKCNYITCITQQEAVDIKCCGENMHEITPNTVDAAKEKHVPVANFKEDYLEVQVGSVLHPMSEEHLINGIYVVTDNGLIIHKELKSTDEPKYVFKVDNAKKVDVYESCNLHGVWKTTVER